MADSPRADAEPGLDDSQDLFDFGESAAAASAPAGKEPVDVDALLRQLTSGGEARPGASASPMAPALSSAAGASPRGAAGASSGAASERGAGSFAVPRSLSRWVMVAACALIAVAMVNSMAVVAFWKGNLDLQRAVIRGDGAGGGDAQPREHAPDRAGHAGEARPHAPADPVEEFAPAADAGNFDEFFAGAEAALADGRSSEVRRSVYGLLCIADRLAPDVRNSVEARSAYLLAAVADAERIAADPSPAADATRGEEHAE
jgi:hypothetical protein